MQNFGKVAVLSGGPSSERDVSVRSADAVFGALCSAGINTVLVDVMDPESLKRDLSALGIDIVFIALHGRFGEDGSVQALLDEWGIPYTGSGPRASKLSFDKALSKEIFRARGIPTPNYIIMEREGFDPCQVRDISLPCVIKPSNEGSSIGMSMVRSKADIMPAIEKAFVYDSKIIIEDYARGADITVGILGDEPLPVISIQPKSGFYDYYSKYTPGASEYGVPADIPGVLSCRAQDLGLAAHKALGCKSLSRVDMILDKPNNIITVLEVNTIPGFTQTSLLPKAARAAGIDFTRMCLDILKYAAEKHFSKNAKADVMDNK
ncbi:MAG: D-alanine--D-alanine ligase [Candidatus Omnitrophota bacterium]|jgi:D-alanine-D-alanine ligase